MSKEQVCSFEEIRASGKCIVPLYFAFSLLLVFACAYVLHIGHFCLFFIVFMAQSKATRQGQRKGKNVSIGDAPPVPLSSGSVSIPSIGSGAATVASNVQGKQIGDPKYPL